MPSTPPLQQGLRRSRSYVNTNTKCEPSTSPLQQGFDAQRRGNHRNSQMIALCYKIHIIDYSSRCRGNIKHRLSQNMAQINNV